MYPVFPYVEPLSARGKRGLFVLLASLTAVIGPAIELSAKSVEPAGNRDEMLLLAEGAHAAPIVVGVEEDGAVRRAVVDLAKDIERVSDVSPEIRGEKSEGGQTTIIVGTIGADSVIDRLIANGQLDVHEIRGKWESYLIRVITSPTPSTSRMLIVAGSDRRGTIYGIYTVSELIGVSPWYWWADVPIKKQNPLAVTVPEILQGPPAVKYRGIFINDEDWGLRPWAAQTFDPDTGNIGPKTYAKVFELLLRLKANLIWPAMHPGTRAFNYYPENKEVANAYGVVMGSSHAEQMLRNNVDEWHRDGKGDYNYVTNRDAVLAYWESRVKDNARFENIYTLGMRGIHDSGMPGGSNLSEKATILARIIADQRALLAKAIKADVSQIPQIFCPYKEVLDIYRFMPPLPEDVTLAWPDDNYGYVQHFSNAVERTRAGGAGVYYHLSYWGNPYDYLWLCSTSPGQIWEEMTKAWDYGARTMWVVNVGDIKPAEFSTEYFLKLAWNPHRFEPEQNLQLLREQVARDFGQEHAIPIVALLQEYFRLCARRRPEHMGFDTTAPLLSEDFFSEEEETIRLQEFERLATRAEALGAALPVSCKTAYYELVLYPIQGAQLANEKGISYFRYRRALAEGDPKAEGLLRTAQTALDKIHEQTRRYNDFNADGKWRGILSDHPRDLPAYSLPLDRSGGLIESNHAQVKPVSTPLHLSPAQTFKRGAETICIAAAQTTSRKAAQDCRWATVEGLGSHGEAVVVSPSTATPRTTPTQILSESPVLNYEISIQSPGTWEIQLQTLPTWPIEGDKPHHYAIAVDQGPLVVMELPLYRGEKDLIWQRDVLRNASVTTTEQVLAGGNHTIRIYMVEPGVVVDGLTLVPRSTDLAHPTIQNMHRPSTSTHP